jgi:hypothetical protein
MSENIELCSSASENRWTSLDDVPPAAGSLLTRPDGVMSDPRLSKAEKRKMLASWVSDARAVPDAPALRRLDSGAIVRVDDVLRALRSLDDAGISADDQRLTHQLNSSFGRHRRRRGPHRTARWNRPDNDDDPPPHPIRAAMPVHWIFVLARSRRTH